MEMIYVDSRETVALELIALNATVDPMFIRDNKQVISHVSMTAFRGMFHPCLTCPMKPANGKPPSRANDQDCRETVARVEITEEVMVTIIIATIMDAPASEPVPL